MADLSFEKLPALGKAGVVSGVMGSLILAAYFFFGYSDMAQSIDNATRKSGDLQRDLATAKEAEQSYIKDVQDLTVLQQRQKELNKALPEDAQPASFLSSIQQVSNISGVDLKGWEPVEERVEGFFARIPMKLELSGRFQQLAKFVYEMGRVDRIINIEDLEMTEPHIDGNEIKLTAKCLATSFHLVPGAAPASSATDQPPMVMQPVQPGAPK